jgi:hypothetical protein
VKELELPLKKQKSQENYSIVNSKVDNIRDNKDINYTDSPFSSIENLTIRSLPVELSLRA